MNLLIAVVEDEEHVEDFLSVLVELDVAGLQVLDSASVVEVLAREAPIFAGLRQLITRPTAASKTLVGIAPKDILPELGRLLKKIGLQIDKPGTGYAVQVPIGGSIGHLDFDSE